MGLVKSQLDRGYHLGDGRVCISCFEDYAISNFVIATTDGVGCDYCADSGNHQRPSVDFDDVMPFIFDGICREYTTPEQSLPLDNESESGYFGTVIEKDDLVRYYVELASPSDDLLQKIIDSIEQEAWCEPDQLYESAHEELIFDWQEFRRLICKEARFVFFRYGTREGNGLQERPVSDILEHIATISERLGLFQTLTSGSEFVRARKWTSKNPYPLTVTELGPPSAKISAGFPNRMSPPGIPMFYGSDEAKTAIAEITVSGMRQVMTSRFGLVKKIKVLDLTRIPPLPSIFDKQKYHLRSSIKFLKSFLKDFSRSVVRDGHEHVDYVPTQVLTEYFRLIVRSENEPVRGIVYPSTRRSNGKSVVLFANRKNCISSSQTVTDESMLRLVSGSIRRHTLSPRES